MQPSRLVPRVSHGRLLGSCSMMYVAASVLDVISFKAAISVCEQGGEWQRLAVINCGSSLDVISFKAAISACKQGGACCSVHEIIRSHIRLWQGWAVTTCGTTLGPLLDEMPRCLAWSASTQPSQRANQVGSGHVFNIFEPLISCGSSLDVIIFNAAISACKQGGQWQRLV
eukprot:5590292-Karenia_brevis.AAC.1